MWGGPPHFENSQSTLPKALNPAFHGWKSDEPMFCSSLSRERPRQKEAAIHLTFGPLQPLKPGHLFRMPSSEVCGGAGGWIMSYCIGREILLHVRPARDSARVSCEHARQGTAPYPCDLYMYCQVIDAPPQLEDPLKGPQTNHLGL